jgi:phospholipase/lecithinase/hemolysin
MTGCLRVHKSMLCWMVAACAAVVLTLPANAAAQAPYSRVVVFGDSQSDSGNAFALLGTTATPPDYTLDPFFIPSAPYARGGQNFTNGATWVEVLARALHVPGSAQPAFRSNSPRASNYAVGAARAREAGPSINLRGQVDAFLLQTGGVAPSDALYILALGSNDVRDAVLAFQAGGFLAAGAVLEAAVLEIQQQIARLYLAGGRHFLIWNSPDVSATPAAQILDSLVPGAAVLGTTLTMQFNALLAGTLGALPAMLPGLHVTQLDVYSLLQDIAMDPARYGFTNISSPCLTPNVPPFTCRQPDRYLFWDGMHPTAAAHALIARAALEALGH